MKEIKFRYRFDRGENFEKVVTGAGKRFTTETVTLEELEKGLFETYYSNYKILSKDQYTGLKDKNEKEIYEGDILIQLYSMGEKEGQPMGKHFAVEWNKEEACFNCFSYEEFVNNEHCKIIGNIYENPELLGNN